MTALTPAQVRDHARALILMRPTLDEVAAYLQGVGSRSNPPGNRNAACDAVADAIRTARITVDWNDAHTYLSTGCLHEEHGYCQAETGICGEKTPAQCKFCAAPCVCPCHTQEAQ